MASYTVQSLLLLRAGSTPLKCDDAAKSGTRFGTLLVQLPCAAKGVRVTVQPPCKTPAGEAELPEARSGVAWLAAYSDCTTTLYPPTQGTALILYITLEACDEVCVPRSETAHLSFVHEPRARPRCALRIPRSTQLRVRARDRRGVRRLRHASAWQAWR